MDNKPDNLGPIKAVLILYRQNLISKYIPIYKHQWDIIVKDKLEKHLLVKNMLLNENAESILLKEAEEHPTNGSWKITKLISEIHENESIKQLRADYGSIERSADWWAQRYLKNEEIKEGKVKYPKADQNTIEAFNKWASCKREELNELRAGTKGNVDMSRFEKKQ